MQIPGWPFNLLIGSPVIKYTIIFEKCTQQKPPHLIDETVCKKIFISHHHQPAHLLSGNQIHHLVRCSARRQNIAGSGR